MAWAGIALSAASAVASASAQQRQARSQAEAARYNAAIEQKQAQQEKEIIYQQSRAKLSEIQAARAKSGVTGEGTPLMVMAESNANAEADVIASQQSADIESALYKSKAESYERAGRAGAGASLLSSFGSMI